MNSWEHQLPSVKIISCFFLLQANKTADPDFVCPKCYYNGKQVTKFLMISWSRKKWRFSDQECQVIICGAISLKRETMYSYTCSKYLLYTCRVEAIFSLLNFSQIGSIVGWRGNKHREALYIHRNIYFNYNCK